MESIEAGGTRRLYGSRQGVASYRLTPDGTVELELRTADCWHRKFVGPIVARPSSRSGPRRAHRAVGIVSLTFAVAVVAGAVIGHAVHHASAGATLAGGVIGLVISPAVLRIAAQLARVRVRREGRQGTIRR